MRDDTELHVFECEVCKTVAHLTDEAAFQEGWDYPPFMGPWQVIAPRTCPNCGMQDTVWWALTTKQELTEEQIKWAEKVMAQTGPIIGKEANGEGASSPVRVEPDERSAGAGDVLPRED